MKNHHFLKFFWWVGTHKAKMSKIEHFWWCFKTCSSHHKLSSKVCKIVLRACRNVFWWKITFWNTSGYNVTSSKSSKSWFFSKIQNSQKMIKTQWRFWWFLSLSTMADYLTGVVQKCDLRPEIASWDLKNQSPIS